MPNVKPKAGVVNVLVVAESDGVLVGVDEMELESEEVVDSEVDAELESEVEGKSEPVGIGMVPMVLAASTFPEEEVVAVPVPVAVVFAAQFVADTVTVDTTVTVTMLSVPMTTVGVTIPFVPEEDVGAEVSALGVILEVELETTDGVELRVGSDDVEVEVDDDVKICRRWRAVLVADVEGVAISVTVTVTIPPVELSVVLVELIVEEVGIVVVDELSPSPSSQPPSLFGSFASILLFVSFPVMPPGTPADTKR